MRSLTVLVVCAALGLSACIHRGGVGGDSIAAALMGTALGVGAAAVSRAEGGCYASCPPGTVCNERTGMCDELPCHGRCGPKERCDRSGLVERCVPDQAEMEIQGDGSEPRRINLSPP